MPVAKRDTSQTLHLQCEDGSDYFFVRHTNRGEPFKEGVELGISNDNYAAEVAVMLEGREAIQLRDLLIAHYPITR
jgi:hypothetical protein